MFDLAPETDQPLMQSPGFAAALALCGQAPRRLPCGLFVLQRRIAGLRLAMLPRAIPPDDLAEQLSFVGLGRTPLLLSPERPCATSGLRLRRPLLCAEVDLTPDAVTRRAALHGKWRNQLRRAEAANLRVRHGSMKPHDSLPQEDEVQARKIGYKSWPAALTQSFASLNPQQTRMFSATFKGHVIARMLFLIHGARATYHIGHTSAQGRSLCAHNLLLWQAQNWLADRGVARLDMGLLTPQTPGLNRFKLRSGAVALPTGGTWLRWTPLARARPA